MSEAEAIAKSRVLQRTQYATFELSNWCAKAHLHPRCFAAHSGAPRHLSSKIIERELRWLGSIGYSGMIMFSVYNEPLTDPRFGWALELVHDLCRWADIEVLTNGENLDQELTDWMIARGVKKIRISCYSESVLDQIQKIDFPKTSYEITARDQLDDRMKWYDREEGVGYREPCFSPFRNLIVRSDGTLGTCCYDCRNELKIGDLKKSTLVELLSTDEIEDRYQKILGMKEGKQPYSFCRKCTATKRIAE